MELDVGGVIACYKLVCYCHTLLVASTVTVHTITTLYCRHNRQCDNVRVQDTDKEGGGVSTSSFVQSDKSDPYYLNALIMRSSDDTISIISAPSCNSETS